MQLFLILLVVPLIEIGLFVQVGGLIGMWPTLAIVAVPALVGAWMVKRQGIRIFHDLQRAAALGDPALPLLHGLLVLVSGVLLVTPGYFTDALGFALLVPAVRSLLISAAGRQIAARAATIRWPGGFQPGHADIDESVIEGSATGFEPRHKD